MITHTDVYLSADPTWPSAISTLEGKFSCGFYKETRGKQLEGILEKMVIPYEGLFLIL
jgi:hypothetical protein